jgi:outer membrane protein assembly factor BamA
VGQIIVVGNETIPQGIILAQLPLYPGQILLRRDVQTAERNLERLGLFVVDRPGALRPTVTILDGGSAYKDIFVRVKERPNARVCWRLYQGGRVLAASLGGGLPAALAAWLAE